MKTIGIIALLLFSLNAAAQDYDVRLLKSYDEVELSEIKSSDPKKIELLNYALDHGMYLSETNSEKSANLAQIQQISEGATFADLGIKISDQNQYFSISGENKVLVVKSYWVLNHELENK